MQKLFVLIFLTVLTACASFSEKVVSRMDDMGQRPEWASVGQAMFEKEGKIYALGYSETSGSARISSAVRVADNNARYEIARLVNNTTSYIFQNAEEGLEGNSEMTRFYGNELAQLDSHGVKQESRYWEKVLITNENGDQDLRLRLYSLVSLEKSEVKKAIKQILDKNKQKLSPEMQKAIDSHMEQQIKSMN